VPVNIIPPSLSPFILTGDLSIGCEWQKGIWDIVELETIFEALKDMNNARVMNGQFQKYLGRVNVKKSIASACGKEFRGCTSGSRDIVFKDAGKPPTSVAISNTDNIDKWTVVHEFGHGWDRNNRWKLSEQMMKYTNSYYNKPASIIKRILGNCDYVDENNHDRYPGCNVAGYYYQGKPPKGSGPGFNHLEDFAEAVTAYVYPGKAEEKVAKYQGSIYEDLFYYEHYSDTQRYDFIQSLLSR